MAHFDIEFPEDLLSELLDSDVDEIAEAALRDASPIMEESMKKSCQMVIDHEGDSEMLKSIKAGAPVKAKNGAWIVNVSPRGYSKTKIYHHKKTKREYPVSNALKMIWKEYGIAGQQAPKPFIQAAVNAARDKAVAEMQKTYNKKVGAE